MKLSGLILCGGQSNRMGSDKGLLLHNDQAWSTHIAEMISIEVPEVFISLRNEQALAYQSLFKTSQMIFDQSDIQAQGPLKGLLSAHKIYPDKNWLVVACDMISINHEIISKLVNIFFENSKFDYYLFKSQHGVEPLCAIYTKDGLSKLIEKISHSSNFPDFSLRRNLDMNHCFIIEADGKSVEALKNYNMMEDLKVKKY